MGYGQGHSYPGQDTLLANDAARDANVTHWCTLALFDSSYRRTVGERPAVQELLSLAQRAVRRHLRLADHLSDRSVARSTPP
jgi:hypothetical protein